MKKMDKKGFVRTIEAIIGILIIFIFIYAVLPRNQPVVQKVPEEIRLLQDIILREIENNSTFRADLLLIVPDKSDIDIYIQETISLVGDNQYHLEIQDVSSGISRPVILDTVDKNIYTDSIVIGSTLNDYRPKLVTLYIW